MQACPPPAWSKFLWYILFPRLALRAVRKVLMYFQPRHRGQAVHLKKEFFLISSDWSLPHFLLPHVCFKKPGQLKLYFLRGCEKRKLD
jgi:hypothetical protein